MSAAIAAAPGSFPGFVLSGFPMLRSPLRHPTPNDFDTFGRKTTSCFMAFSQQTGVYLDRKHKNAQKKVGGFQI
ncbi:hypothetical protein [Marimonas lutisalis]|uniref:hypothetical protein n=1 Tax=Marimonas lutisalis TaxID=2545756 RepID=UPI001375A2CC|nr:hypothetical protein [Marimonas lutisalis]